jgi:hypothetical protein
MEGQEVELPPDGESKPAGVPAGPRTSTAGSQTEAWRPVVPHEVVSAVIGRAAELERDGWATAGHGFDEQSVVEIGREVGLTPAVVRKALDEYHAGLLGSDAEQQTVVGPRVLVVERTVPGSLSRVEGLVDALLQGKLFDCCRRSGNQSMWRPREGLLATIQRAGKRLSRDRTLDDVTEITVGLVELPAAPGPPASVRVRFEVECRAMRQGLVATTVGGVAAGGAGAVAVTGAAIVVGDPLPLLGLPALGALASGAYFGSRAVYRRKLAEVELVIQGGLDQLVLAPGHR